MIDFRLYDVVVVGCGLSGAVIAEHYARIVKKRVVILEKRDHIGGNCYDCVDENNILYNKYGPHFFHTNHEDVWEYIHRFSEWERYDHKVLGNIDGKTFPIPVNINTVNILCGQNIRSEEEMCEWLSTNQVRYENITNSEEIAKSRVGDELYNLIFKDYTFKQWGKYPNELQPDVLARIPIRTNFDDRYFTDKYQVLPKYGYTEFFKTLLNHANITVHLNTDFFAIKDLIPSTTTIVYTGPIDRYFADQGLEPLEYRSLNIVFESHKNTNFYQTNTQVNYPGLNEPFTRITEYKHCLHQSSPHTTISKEYSTDQGEPYYPVLSDRNVKLFEKYQQLADAEMARRNIHFLGRLANYKYFNMDAAIKNAIDYFHLHLVKSENPLPKTE